MQLYETHSMNVAAWREEEYQHETFPAIAEILEYARQPDMPNFRLRAPQLTALETYWYLRLVEETPNIFELYTNLFPKVTERLTALGMTHPDMRELVIDIGFDGLIEKVREDDEFVKKYKLEAVRETLTLDYPSYILALADVPEKKNDLVDGKYVVKVKKGATVAVKVTDMLGEEVLVVKGV